VISYKGDKIVPTRKQQQYLLATKLKPERVSVHQSWSLQKRTHELNT